MSNDQRTTNQQGGGQDGGPEIEETARIDLGQPDEQPGGSSSEYRYGLYKLQTRYDPISILFALLVFIGGVIGYMSKQSSASLIAGTVFALLLAAATYIEGARKNPYPLLVTLAALAAMMGYRYSQSGNFMPSGLVLALTIIMIARHSYLIYLRRQAAVSRP